MNKKVVIIAIVLVAGIFCYLQLNDESEKEISNKPSYTLQSYADVGGVDVIIDDNDTYVPNYDYGAVAGMQTQCPICHGDGKSPCSGCDGLGKTYQTKDSVNFGYGSSSYEVSSSCRQCGGSGKTPCMYCGGDGLL